ncbi:PIG-L family deacetylase [Dermatophilus congolensis]|uniref:PIG-L family deacetylase n=1 Tax=Dermatophilus congolensis TaxID=1863 RepID=UPI001AAE2C56|nr:hypothetical protein [Dermatophilus congolensis]MBO3152490.1 hypothetical protein [Dermatophilus congolensis]MBO3160499.1 hypothetical protein [Dermatophilus congolensis]MBO3163776.1 hypothetical protein [Dermatophilus congolensis]MBO3177322.1 hypothetical protein [Dermatophilus congolensis]
MSTQRAAWNGVLHGRAHCTYLRRCPFPQHVGYNKLACCRITTTSPSHVDASAAPSASSADSARRSESVRSRLQHRAHTQVYISPHQDDETLSMGAAIAADTAAGKDVHLILVTQGNNARGHRVVNNALTRAGLPPITQAQYQAGRNAEFISAAKKLDVKTQNIHFLGVEDTDEPQPFRAAIDRIINTYGLQAAYNSMSWLDKNPAHYHLADHLDRQCREGNGPECHFYQYSSYQPDAPSYAITTAVTTPIGVWIPSTDGRVLHAAEEYRRWDPSNGRYAIGWKHSVSRSFRALRERPGVWTHGPSSRDAWATDSDRTRALNWIATTQSRPDSELATLR